MLTKFQMTTELEKKNRVYAFYKNQELPFNNNWNKYLINSLNTFGPGFPLQEDYIDRPFVSQFPDPVWIGSDRG